MQTTITVMKRTPTQLTASAVTACRIQPHAAALMVQATTTATPPTEFSSGITIEAGDVVTEADVLSTLFHGIGTSVYLWGYSVSTQRVAVSYA